MKTLFFSLLILASLHSFSLRAEELWVTNKNQLPSEFSYLLEALQKTDFTPNEKRKLSSQLKELDVEFSLMTREEIFLIIKGEIYKTLLTYYKGSSDTLLEQEQINLLDKNLQEKGPKLNAFALWLMIALKTDAEVLLGHPQFGQLKLGANNKELLRLKKKMTVIAPWIQNFLSMNVDEFHNELRPLLWEIFSRIENSARLFVMVGRFEKGKAKDGALRYFVQKEVSSAEFFPELENWLRREALKNEKEVPATNEWKPKDNKDPNYVAPKALPKPVDDWMGQSEWNSLEKNLLKTPEPSNNSPKVLPKPVDDWILDD